MSCCGTRFLQTAVVYHHCCHLHHHVITRHPQRHISSLSAPFGLGRGQVNHNHHHHNRIKRHHHLQQQQQQRRHYLYFPSDWSELRHRWNLFWEQRKTRIRLKFQDRYVLEKNRLQDFASKRKRQVRDRKNQFVDQYEEEKQLFKHKLSDKKAQFKQNYQTKRESFQQRRGEFTKRWSARRRDIWKDSKNYLKGYVYRQRLRLNTTTKLFTIDEYCQPDWFDPLDGRPLTSQDPTGRYVNPWMSWSTNGVHKVRHIVQWRYQRAVKLWNERGIWSFIPKDLPQLLLGPTVVKDHDALEKSHYTTTSTTASSTSSSNVSLNIGSGLEEEQVEEATAVSPTDIQFTWIGHSTCLIRMGHATLLTDPIFSHRCTPFPRLPGIGVPRDVPPSMTMSDLPSKIDVCMISHDHYDHMDQQSILYLRDRVQYWVCPKGLPEWLETRCSVDPHKMIELEWWQSAHWTQHQDISTNADNNNNNNNNNNSSTSQPWQLIQDSATHDAIFHNNTHNANINTMTVTCTPAQHWSSRTFFDRCKRLWCSFAVETRTHPLVDDEVHNEEQDQPLLEDEPVVQKFFFAGDTGMPRNGFPLFQQIGDFCGRGRYHYPRGTKEVAEAITQAHAPSIRNHSSLGDATSLALSSLAEAEAGDDDDDDHHHPNDDDDDHHPHQETPFHPFDLAALPIGAYEPSYLMQDAHMNPMEAVQCARQLQARKSVAIHWGTFALSEEPMEEPPQKLQEALLLEGEKNSASIDFVTLPIGGTMRVPATTLMMEDDDDDDYEEDEDGALVDLDSDSETIQQDQSLNVGK